MVPFFPRWHGRGVDVRKPPIYSIQKAVSILRGAPWPTTFRATQSSRSPSAITVHRWFLGYLAELRRLMLPLSSAKAQVGLDLSC